MSVLIFDLETTGVDHEKDQIIEAAWLEMPPNPDELSAYRNADAFTSYGQMFRPTVPISLGAQAVHHILCSDLIGCDDPKSFKLPSDCEYLIGHNVDFDAKFADAMHLKRICTLALSRFLFPDKDSHTQSAMLYLIGRRNNREPRIRDLLKNAHRALDDVKNCSILLRFLITEAATAGHNVTSWHALHQLSELARLPTVMGFGKHKGTTIARGQLDASYVSWYRRQDQPDPYYLEAFKRAGF